MLGEKHTERKDFVMISTIFPHHFCSLADSDHPLQLQLRGNDGGTQIVDVQTIDAFRMLEKFILIFN